MMRSARELTRWHRSEIPSLFKKAKPLLRTPALDIRVAPAKLNFGRILIVIPRKVGTAPQRNKLRRQIRALFYENKTFNHTLDWVFFFKPTGKKNTFEELCTFFSRVQTYALEKASHS